MTGEPGAPLSKRATVIIAGGFGSGKTEVAVSYALAARAGGRRVCIADLDVVTPYFRVGDYRGQLEHAGLRVIAPEGELTSFELPALSPEIAGAIAEPGTHLVLDAGGDPAGARLLAAFAEAVRTRGYDLWLVVNPFRPATSSPEGIAEQARAIEAQCELQLTGLVANPNLGPMTAMGDVRQGLEEIRAGAKWLHVPIVLLAIARPLLGHARRLGHPLLPMDLLLRLPWQVA